jgi:hypothetical protein
LRGALHGQVIVAAVVAIASIIAVFEQEPEMFEG